MAPPGGGPADRAPLSVLIGALGAAPVVAIARGLDPDRLVPAAHAALDAGIRVIEVTMDSPDAAASIAALAGPVAAQGGCVGAGTVVSEADLAAALEAGAAFCVAPHLDTGLLASATTRGVPFVPGVVTPTEVAAALSAGAEMVKLFPAGSLGPGWVRALRGPYADLQVLVTGGIGPSEVGEWLSAGATAVGLGGELFGRGPDVGDPAQVKRLCSAALAAVRVAGTAP